MNAQKDLLTTSQVPKLHISSLRLILRSAVFRLAFLMFIVIVPVCILTMVMSSRAINMAENQVSSDIQEALNLNINQVDGYLQNLGRRLYTVSRENEDYARLMTAGNSPTATATDQDFTAEPPAAAEATASEPDSTATATDPDLYIEQMHSYLRLGQVFTDILSEYPWADNVVAGFPDSGYFISADSSQIEAAGEIFRYETEHAESGRGNWHVSESNSSLLVGYFEYRNTYYGASFRLDKLLENIMLDTSSNIVVFAGKEKGILSDREVLREIPVFSENRNVTVNGERYIVLTTESNYSDLVLVDLVSRNMLDQMLPGYMRILFLISIAFLISIPLLFLAFARWLVRPVNILIDAINYVDNGNLDYRIGQKTGTYEFDLLNNNFNEMMDSVKDLKINVYEKELERQDIRLQYLSQQIQPHFILNAMNIIYSYEPEEYDLIQKMVLCLSKYFQFIVNANRPYVTVREELDHISNYLAIQKIRYGQRIRYQVNVQEDASNAIMPPLMIQNLVENVIKYALRDDGPVEIDVSAQMIDFEESSGAVQTQISDSEERSAEVRAQKTYAAAEQATQSFVRITIRDTGHGIQDETLQQIRTFQETKIRQEGLGVGIQNTIERLELFFGSKASFHAARWQQDEGTEIILTFPARYPEKVDEEEL